ncbi:ComEC/Rec2 family competence protein [Roseibium litorale]|uniref:ComEC/Rec2 family competence protein n=1 Tax=Roseibium litorale TaxID=2803841 RepID=A0ABR9CJL8_9HYPH|nr:ComEC/Rec2 family competence protein [Roseibium litorale]MBD8891050.1 ComEC/Rec2 family competence protein [Roseibium litorale]
MAGTGDRSGSGPDRKEPGQRAGRGLGRKGRQEPDTPASAGAAQGPKDDTPSAGAVSTSDTGTLIARGKETRLGFERPNWTRPEAYGFAPAKRDHENAPYRAPKALREGRLREEQGLLWGGFALASGILAYFSLPEEPSALAVIGAALALGLWAAWRDRSRGFSLAVVLSLWFAAGFTAGTLRTALVAAPKLEAARTLEISGIVAEREQAASGPRLIIDVLQAGNRGRMAPPGPQRRGPVIPARIRVSAPQESGARAGDHVRLKARLFPPSSPIRPGGYDFSFTAYFSGIGATGFSYGKPEIEAQQAGFGFRRELDDLRQLLAAKIRRTLPPGDPAELAVALLVGERAGLSEQAEESLRAAGLAHVLAISGLHMALFAGGAYTALLLLLALFEPLALRLPLHKIAASAALMAAAFYLLLSGASVSTQRAFIMISLVFIGILTARRGLTLHSVALAGITLLLARPEQLFHPGFQMSFASVICLIAVYGRWSESRLRTLMRTGHAHETSLAVRLALTPLLWGGGVLATTAIAGLATGIIGAHHFGRIASYGMIGNLLGMPLVSLVIMPMGVLSLVLMPFGLSALPLFVMDKGLSMLLAVAAWTEALDDGKGALIPPGALATLFLTTGLFWLLLTRGRWRFGAVALICAGWVGLSWERPADIQIADLGGVIAARDAEGVLRLSSVRASFAGEMWLQAEGVSPEGLKSRKMAADQAACDETGCVYLAYGPDPTGPERNWGGMLMSLFGIGPGVSGQGEGVGRINVRKQRSNPASSDSESDLVLRQPLRVALPKTPEALELDCLFADIIVTALDVPSDCAVPLVIGGSDRLEIGALSFWLKDSQVTDSLERPGGVTGARENTQKDPALGAGPATGGERPLRVKTTLSAWTGAKTRPPRPWHR